MPASTYHWNTQVCAWWMRTARIVREAKILSEPDALIAWFGEHGVAMERIGLEAGPLSQWLHAGMVKAGLSVELIETRHVRSAFKTMPVKTDKKDARGIAQLMRFAWLVQTGPLQISCGPGGACAADCPQAHSG
ncbi:transposase [Sinorhizobium fredii]